MCFAFDARPPELPAELRRAPIAGGAAAELIELESADGTRFSAALASVPEPAPVGAVVLPDVRGLYPFYIELADRFAAAGHAAIAIDYFGRTAGRGPRGEDFDPWPHVEQVRLEQVHGDISAAVSALRERAGVSGAVTVGFCFGGMLSFLAGTYEDLALDGVAGFYGALSSARFGGDGPLERAGDIRCPVLGLFGGADDNSPEEQVREFARRLDGAGVEHEIHTYPGAPHSFFDRRASEHAEASADAWRRVLGFLGTVAAVA